MTMTTRSEAMITPRALLYVATEAGGAACWADDILVIEDSPSGGSVIHLTPYSESVRCINSTWTTQQVVEALREIPNRTFDTASAVQS